MFFVYDLDEKIFIIDIQIVYLIYHNIFFLKFICILLLLTYLTSFRIYFPFPIRIHFWLIIRILGISWVNLWMNTRFTITIRFWYLLHSWNSHHCIIRTASIPTKFLTSHITIAIKIWSIFIAWLFNCIYFFWLFWNIKFFWIFFIVLIKVLF